MHEATAPFNKFLMTNELNLTFDLADQAATAVLASQMCRLLQQGDVVALSGDLGAGKTAFARAFIQAMGQLQGTSIDEVPSPTFTIVQVYDELQPAVWHVDLYRLEGRADTFELGLEEAFENGITLIEWPDRLGDALPDDHLALEISMTAKEGERRVHLTGSDVWLDRLAVLETQHD